MLKLARLLFFPVRAMCIRYGAISKPKDFQCELSNLIKKIKKEKLSTSQVSLSLWER